MKIHVTFETALTSFLSQYHDSENLSLPLMKYAVLGLFVVVLLLGIKQARDFYGLVHERKAKMEDYAEINKVNYELFNMQIWKDEALEIMKKQIKDFEISDQMYDVLDDQFKSYLNTLHDRYVSGGELATVVLDEVRKSGKVNKLFMGIIEKQVPRLMNQMDLRPQIPGVSQQIIREIKNNEPLIKSYMQQELLRLVLDDANANYRDRREGIYAKYEQVDLENTDSFLLNEVQRLDGEIRKTIIRLILIIGIAIVLGIVLGRVLEFIYIVLRPYAPLQFIFIFELLGDEIEFDEQVIYYQSKSIVEVTQTLWRGGTWDLKLVGVLVIMFSIIFPAIKLLLSGLFLWVDKVRHSKLAQGFIFHLGKWSMADVFVVAIFMAYIGFYGIISSQLNGISQNQGGFAIETVNYSRLAPGAFFFTAYTVLSIGISILINRHAKKTTVA